MTITLIVAQGKNGVIGREGALPWSLKDDLAFFKAHTIGKPILMGRKTWMSIGRALPGRANIVITRDPAFIANGAWVFGSIEAGLQTALALAHVMPTSLGDVCIIGGGEIYRQTMPFADRLQVTEVDATPLGDTVFPSISMGDWHETALHAFSANARNQHAFVIRTLERRH